MARIEYPVWTVSRAILAMPFRYAPALVKFGLLPLLIAAVCLPPTINVGNTTTMTVDGVAMDPVGELYSTTDNELGLRDLIGFVLMLPFAAAFAAAWNRLTATGDVASMGRPPIAFDGRTVSVIWAFLRLTGVSLGVGLILFILSLLVFGSYRDGTLSYSYNISVDGIGPSLALMAGALILVLAIVWFILRFALVIPASAMGEPMSLRASWRASGPIQLRLLGAACVLGFVFLLLNLLLSVLMLPVYQIAGAQAAFCVTLVLTFPLLAYGHAIWAGLLGSTYGLLQLDRGAAEAAAKAKVFD
jgi:hypothetical protein